jgi:hypothetical protein
MNKTTLIIIGCSWFCGEWNLDQNNNLKINHPGLNEYLNTHFRIVNLSRGGASNWQSLYALSNYLNLNHSFLSKFHVIVGQTDPMRDSVSKHYDINYSSIISRAGNMSQLYQELTEIFYIKLSELAVRYQFTPYLVGGLSDVDYSTVGFYETNINVLIPSWIQLLDKSHQFSVCPLVFNSNQLKNIKDCGRMDIVNEMLSFNDSNFLRAQELMESKWFGPSFGDFHPNRLAHQILANKIVELLHK